MGRCAVVCLRQECSQTAAVPGCAGAWDAGSDGFPAPPHSRCHPVCFIFSPRPLAPSLWAESVSSESLVRGRARHLQHALLRSALRVTAWLPVWLPGTWGTVAECVARTARKLCWHWGAVSEPWGQQNPTTVLPVCCAGAIPQLPSSPARCLLAGAGSGFVLKAPLFCACWLSRGGCLLSLRRKCRFSLVAGGEDPSSHG